MKHKLFFLFLLLLIITSVKAEECIHINNNGVEMECEKYNMLKEYYSEKLLESFYQSEYDAIKNNDINNIETNTYEEPILTRGSYFASNFKTIQIIKNGTFITASLTWTQNPSTRSHDVFAIRLLGPSIFESPIFRQIYMVGNVITTSTTAYKKTFSNGVGYSFKLPNNYNGLESHITFSVLESGKIYSSYQHATSSISLNNSKKYTLSYAGYGNTILFDDSVKYYYDNMTGVDLTV